MPARTVEIAFLGSTAQLEAALARAGLVAEKSGTTIGDAFTKGTSKAGGAVSSLANKAGALGIPLSGSLAKVGTALDQAASKTNKLGVAFAALGKVGVTAGLGAFAVAAYEGVKGAAALQQQMEKLHTQAGASQAEVTRMTKAVLGMAASVGTNPDQLAQGLYHVESAGFRGAKAMDILTTAAKGAKIGGADLTDVTNALDAAVFSGISGAQNFNAAMGTLNATVGAGDMTMQNLAEALGGPMLATVKGYGLSLKDIGAALATFGDLNIRGSDAATQLRMAVQYMAKPAATAAPMLKALGLNTQSFANALANGGLLPALQLLKQHLEAANVPANRYAQVVSDLFSKKGSAGVEILLNSLDKLQSKYTYIGKGAGSFNSDWTSTTKNLSFQFSQLEAGAAAFADKLGGYLIPKIQALGNFVANNKTTLEALARLFGVVLVAAMVKFATQSAIQFGKWLTSFKGMVSGAAEQSALLEGSTGLGGVAASAEAATTKVGLLKSAISGLAGKVFTATVIAEVIIKIGDFLSAGAEAAAAQQETKYGINPQTGNLSKAYFQAGGVPKNLPRGTTTIASAEGVLQKAGFQQTGSDLREMALELLQDYGVNASRFPGPDSGKRSPINSILTANYSPKSPGGGGGGGGGAGGGMSPAVTNALNGTTAAANKAATAAAAAARKLQALITTDTSKGQSELGRLQTGATSASFNRLRTELTGVAVTKFSELNAALLRVHNKGLTALSAQLKTAWDAAMAAYKAILATLSTTAAADTAQAVADKLTAQTTARTNVSAARTTISGLVSQQTSDRLNAAAQAINDAAKLEADAANLQVLAISAQTTAMKDTADAQIAAINDQTQTQVDTLAEKGLYGLALTAQMAKVALDQQKAVDDQRIAAAQAHLDQITAQTNADVAAAQLRADQVTQETNAAVATAKATADAVSIRGAIDVAKAQANADQVAIKAAVDNAAAQAHVDAVMFGTRAQQEQAAAAQKLVNAQSSSATATANATLAAATATANSNNQDAQNAYSQAQAYATRQQAAANAALGAAQNNASILQALAQQQLGAIQNAAGITEAKLNSIFEVDTELANTQFAGGGTVIQLYGIPADNAAAIGNAVDWAVRTATPAPVGS